jgi:DNA replication and repair protein RecF
LYLVATTKSHRGAKDKEIIRFDEEEAHIKLNIEKKEIERRIDMHLRRNGNKGAAIDGLPIRRVAELFGMVNIIFFSPEDLSIIKDGPNERRKFMDTSLCQLSKIYYSNLGTYNKIINQRNNLLRSISFDNKLIDTLDVWDDQLVSCGVKIVKERRNFIQMMNEIIKDIHLSLTSGKEEIELRYEASVLEYEYDKDLKKKRDMDLKYMSTQIGPHRDDIGIFINGKDVRLYGSQGQQRTAALSLKLSEIELTKKIIDDNPILLLDDVMSELDSKRRDALLNQVKDIQCIITCTGYDDFIKERINIDKIINVTNGTVTVENRR